MNITIVGTGNVGGALGRAWSSAHTVTLAVRNPESATAVALAEATGAPISPIGPDAVADADVVVLAVPWDAAVDVARSLGGLEGKIVVDPTNPLAGLDALAVGTTTSAGEQLAAALPEAAVVKAFNTIGTHHFADPVFGGEAATMFLAGNDTEAKQRVSELAAELGFEPLDVGPIAESRYLEALAMLWIRLTYVQQRGPLAFRVVKGDDG